MTNMSSGNFFTDQRVAIYWIHDRAQNIDSATFDTIKDINLEEGIAPNWDDLHKITITQQDDSQFTLYISGEFEYAQSFYDALVETWKSFQQKQLTENHYQ